MLKDPVRAFAKPLTSDPAIDNEPINVLKREVCSVMADDEPNEPNKNSARPLNRVAAIDIEPVNVLKIDVCLVSVEEVPTEPERSSTRTCPSSKDAEIPIEPVRNLAKPLFSEAAKDSDAVRVLLSPFV